MIHRRITLPRRARTVVLLAIGLLVPALLLAAEAEHAAVPEKSSGELVSQTIWAIASFVVVLAILLKKVMPPIVKAMDRRAADIRDALSAADKARAEAQELIARHEASLEKARKEAMAIIEEGKADAIKVKDGIIASARSDAEEIAGRARREIELAKRSAMDDLHRRAVDLSIGLASDLIKKNLRPEDHQDLIQERIRGLPAA